MLILKSGHDFVLVVLLVYFRDIVIEQFYFGWDFITSAKFSAVLGLHTAKQLNVIILTH